MKDTATPDTRVMTQRIVGLDVARALAVIGMVIVNFKVVMVTDNSPGWLATTTGLLEGRAAATFVVLAGIGISLLSRRARESGERGLIRRDQGTILKRALFLFVVGLLYMPLWPADILHFYGVYLAIAALVLVSPSRRLWQLAIGFVVGFVVLLALFDYEAGWDWDTFTYDGFWTLTGFMRNLLFNGFHPVVPWTAFVFVGMWLGRLNLNDVTLRRRVLTIAAAVAVAAETGSYFLVRVATSGLAPETTEDVSLLLGTQMIPPVPLYMVAGAATAIVVILLSVELGERATDATWLRSLVYTGQLALTLYVAHVVIGMGLLDILGLLYNQTLEFSVAAATVFSVAAIAFSWAWRSRFDRGPLEHVMRRLTDAKV